MDKLSQYFAINLSPEMMRKALASLLIFLLLTAIRWLVIRLMRRRISEASRLYHSRRLLTFVYSALLIVLVGRIWVQGIQTLATFLGLASAGLAIALHDTVANIAGFVFIMWRKPFSIGDRIEIGGVKGDVIDIRILQFSVVEVGNWIDADQSTGRIVHVPNSKVLREPTANYEAGFEYVWHEIPVLITFESNWRKAKDILKEIAETRTEDLSAQMEEQIRRAAMKYLIFFKNLTPIVYTTVRDSGVLLTIRYIVKPRRRRGTEAALWEAILEAFAQHDDIELAYPTTRMYRRDLETA